MSQFSRFSSTPSNFTFGFDRASNAGPAVAPLVCSASAPTTVHEKEAIEISDDFVRVLLTHDSNKMYTYFLTGIQRKLAEDGTLNWHNIMEIMAESGGEGEKNHCKYGSTCRNKSGRHHSTVFHPETVREQFVYVWSGIKTAFSYSMNVCGMVSHFKNICEKGIMQLRSGVEDHKGLVWILITILLALAILEAGGETDAISNFTDELFDIISTNLDFFGQFGVIVWSVIRAGGSMVGLVNDVVYYTFFQAPSAFVKVLMSTFLACLYPAIAGIGAAFQTNPLVTTMIAVGTGPIIIREGGSTLRLVEKNVAEYLVEQIDMLNDMRESINTGSTKALNDAQYKAQELTKIFQQTISTIGVSHLGPLVPISRKLEVLSNAGKEEWVREVNKLNRNVNRITVDNLGFLEDSNNNSNNEYHSATDEEMGSNNNYMENTKPGRKSKGPKTSKAPKRSKGKKRSKMPGKSKGSKRSKGHKRSKGKKRSKTPGKSKGSKRSK